MLKISGVAVCGALSYVLLKAYKPEYAVLSEICTVAVVFFMTVDKIIELKSVFSILLANAGIDSEYFSILIKALGAAVITEISANTAKDSGQSALASKIELAGRVVIIYCAVPLLKGISGMIRELAENM